MNVVGLERPAFVTFISFPVGVPISTSSCLCASNHLTHGSIPFCMSSGLAVCICCSADTGDKYNNKYFFISRVPPLILFLFPVPTNSNNVTNDHQPPPLALSLFHHLLFLQKNQASFHVHTHCT